MLPLVTPKPAPRPVSGTMKGPPSVAAHVVSSNAIKLASFNEDDEIPNSTVVPTATALIVLPLPRTQSKIPPPRPRAPVTDDTEGPYELVTTSSFNVPAKEILRQTLFGDSCTRPGVVPNLQMHRTVTTVEPNNTSLAIDLSNDPEHVNKFILKISKE